MSENTRASSKNNNATIVTRKRKFTFEAEKIPQQPSPGHSNGKQKKVKSANGNTKRRITKDLKGRNLQNKMEKQVVAPKRNDTRQVVRPVEELIAT